MVTRTVLLQLSFQVPQSGLMLPYSFGIQNCPAVIICSGATTRAWWWHILLESRIVFMYRLFTCHNQGLMLPYFFVTSSGPLDNTINYLIILPVVTRIVLLHVHNQGLMMTYFCDIIRSPTSQMLKSCVTVMVLGFPLSFIGSLKLCQLLTI